MAALVLVVGASAALSSPVRASTWRVVSSKSASGHYPAFRISASINRPQGIGVTMSSPTHVFAEISWGCRKGFTSGHWQIGVLGGFHALPHVRGEDSCQVSVSAHGRDRITVKILKKV